MENLPTASIFGALRKGRYSTDMNILIIGCNGQLGTELGNQLTRGTSDLAPIPADYRGTSVTGLDVPDVDVTNLPELTRQIKAFAPDILFNCAGYTNVDGCETHADDAFRVNAIGTRNLAMAAESVGAKLIHLSTDYVFSGEGTSPYREFDLPNPQSVYGATKLAGEAYAQAFCSRWFVVRTSWLYGHHGKNFVKTMLRLAKEREEITVVDDQLGNPTNAADLAYHLLKIALTEEYGVYHCTGGGICSWYAFASRIVELSGLPARVKPCTTAEYASPTKRPAYSALDHAMLRATVGDEMRPWQDALADFMQQLQQEA